MVPMTLTLILIFKVIWRSKCVFFNGNPYFLTPKLGGAGPSNYLENQVQGQSCWYHWVASSVPFNFCRGNFFISFVFTEVIHVVELKWNTLYKCRNQPYYEISYNIHVNQTPSAANITSVNVSSQLYIVSPVIVEALIYKNVLVYLNYT